MRDYFLHLLQNLDKLTGIRQFEKLCQLPDYKSEINQLLDILCRTCDQFKYIPENAKMKIIDNAIVTEAEFTGLNARVVYKWLNAHKDVYFKESAHMPVGEEYQPLTGDARDRRLQEWLEALKNFDVVPTERSDPYKKVREEWKHKDGEKYTPISQEALHDKDKHFAYLQYCYDSKTAKPNENWMPEEEFNRLYDEGLI